jgi:hypothetical protein
MMLVLSAGMLQAPAEPQAAARVPGCWRRTGGGALRARASVRGGSPAGCVFEFDRAAGFEVLVFVAFERFAAVFA